MEEEMSEILETIMLVCFGLSWPISVSKHFKSRTATGMSPAFILLIIVGYIAGIIAKTVTGNTNFVLYVYIINLLIVVADFAVYFRNKNIDKRRISKNDNIVNSGINSVNKKELKAN